MIYPDSVRGRKRNRLTAWLQSVLPVCQIVGIIAIMAVSAQAEEYWLSRSKTGATVLVLKDNGRAEYLHYSERPDRTLYFSHEPDATWAEQPISSNVGIPVRGSPNIMKATRGFWVKTSKYRFDYLEGDGRVFEIDKMGVQYIFDRVTNQP